MQSVQPSRFSFNAENLGQDGPDLKDLLKLINDTSPWVPTSGSYLFIGAALQHREEHCRDYTRGDVVSRDLNTAHRLNLNALGTNYNSRVRRGTFSNFRLGDTGRYRDPHCICYTNSTAAVVANYKRFLVIILVCATERINTCALSSERRTSNATVYPNVQNITHWTPLTPKKTPCHTPMLTNNAIRLRLHGELFVTARQLVLSFERLFPGNETRAQARTSAGVFCVKIISSNLDRSQFVQFFRASSEKDCTQCEV